MANKAQVKITRTGRRIKYPNLRRAAERMGYNFTYLYRVLEGREPHYKGRKGLKEEYWKVAAEIEAERKRAVQGDCGSEPAMTNVQKNAG